MIDKCIHKQMDESAQPNQILDVFDYLQEGKYEEVENADLEKQSNDKI